jgi:hypothetical protein
VATFCSLCYTTGIMLFFFPTSANNASGWSSTVISTFGYWFYIPAQFMVMYTRWVLKPLTNFII